MKAELIESPGAMRERSRAARAQGRSIGFVPTMGYLHEGHLSLMRRARSACGLAVASIFVNPAQFGHGEDLDRYPRNLSRDRALVEEAGLDVLFHPTASSMYNPDHSTWVTVEGLTEGLCGASRPGHFRGVATIVAKLLNIVEPDVLYLGQKDAQQAIVLRAMVRDLSLATRVEICPTIREKDGLAMSSRNEYLSKTERASARVLYRALDHARQALDSGERSPRALVRRVHEVLAEEPLFVPEYVSLVGTSDLKPLEEPLAGEALLVLAGRIGKTRLIDNVILAVKA